MSLMTQTSPPVITQQLSASFRAFSLNSQTYGLSLVINQCALQIMLNFYFHNSQGMVFYNVGWSMSILTAPFIGGLLAEPASKYGAVMRHLPQCVVDVLKRFPFLLPNLVAVFCNVVSIFVFAWKLKETRCNEEGTSPKLNQST